MHGGGGQFLVDDHDGLAVFILVTTVFFHLDRSVDKQGFKNLFRRIFGNAPHAVTYGHVPDAYFRQPAPKRGQIADLLRPLAAVQVFHKVRNDLCRNPGRSEFDADVHGLNVRRHGGGQRLHIGSETRVRLRGFLRPRQFCPHIAGQVSVADFPFPTGGIQENLPMFPQFRLNVLRLTMQKLRHAAEIHPAVFPQGNEQGVSGVFRRFRRSLLCQLHQHLIRLEIAFRQTGNCPDRVAQRRHACGPFPATAPCRNPVPVIPAGSVRDRHASDRDWSVS